jgi:two-component system, NtrC family, response regulator HydG
MAGSATILVVDDSPDAVELARRHLVAAGYRVHTASSVPDALRALDDLEVDLVITDLRMPEVDGLDLVRHVRENSKATEVIVLTAYATVSGAVAAVKLGANEYIMKPYSERELLDAVERVLEKQRRNRVALPERSVSSPAPEMLGASAEMQQVFTAVRRAAASDATVLITGESGTGKELVARAIHRQSARALGPLVPVNCGAIPQELFENELFGHAKGAFTGASESHPGFFQAADGGTLFLDEISELGLKLQVKLLRVLQDREVYMIGATRPRKVNVRIVTATGKDLSKLVDEGTFRHDLFFRLSVLTIPIAPLRERGDDVLMLARHYAHKFAGEAGKPAPVLSDDLLDALVRHAWPGNVRELENLMQRLVVMADGRELSAADLPPAMRFSAARHDNGACRLEDAERAHIKRVLESAGGNKTKAAKILGIDRKTLREKLKPQ